MDGYGCENSRSSKTSFRILSTDVNVSTLELSTPSTLNARNFSLARPDDAPPGTQLTSSIAIRRTPTVFESTF